MRRFLLLPLFLIPLSTGAAAAAEEEDQSTYSGTVATIFTYPPGASACGVTSRTVSSSANVTLDSTSSNLNITSDNEFSISYVGPLQGASDGSVSISSTPITDPSLLMGYLVNALVPSAGDPDPCQPPIQSVVVVEDASISASTNTKGEGKVGLSGTVMARIALPQGMSGDVKVGFSMAFQGTSVSESSKTADEGSAAAASTSPFPSAASSSGSSSTTTAPSSTMSPTAVTTSGSSPLAPHTSLPTSAPAEIRATHSGAVLPAGSIAAITISIATITSFLLAALIFFLRRRGGRAAKVDKKPVTYPELAYLYDPQRGRRSRSASEVSSVLEMGGMRTQPGASSSQENMIERPAGARVAETRPPQGPWPEIRQSEHFFHPAYRSEVGGGTSSPFDDRDRSREREEVVVRNGLRNEISVAGGRQNFF